MKILHCLAWYFPESSGGTEVYVEGLVRSLRELGSECAILAATEDGGERAYLHAGVRVQRYPAADVTERPVQRGGRAPASIARFEEILRAAGDADIYHQHSWTPACGLHHLRAAKSAGLRTVLTIHVPSPICLRGSMRLFGGQACDGHIRETRCGACWANGRGVPALLARPLASMPLRLSERALRSRSPGPWVTGLAARALGHEMRSQFEAMVESADRIVAVCGWLLEALRKNGVPEEKLALSRQGVDPALAVAGPARRERSGRFRIGFLGRWHPTKGIHVLLEALRRLPADLPVEVAIYGMASNAEDRSYRDRLVAAHGADPRLRIEEPVPREGVAQVLAGLDLLAVPSTWMETGPLVVLEAQAAGVPVLGSNLGSIAELVRHGQDGWLVDPTDAGAWAEAIAQAVTGTLRFPGAGDGSIKVRTMDDAAQEMRVLYGTLRP